MAVTASLCYVAVEAVEARVLAVFGPEQLRK